MRIVVQTRQLGSRRKLLEDWSCDLPPQDDAGFGDGGLTLRELIERIVQREVKAFRDRQNRNRLVHVLSAHEIEAQAEKGRVLSGGSELAQTVDEEAAVATALQAFEDGLYIVILDEREQRDLGARVYLQEDSTLVFLRLTFLAGA